MAAYPSVSKITNLIASSGFGHLTLAYLEDPRFQDYEVNYKLRLAHELRRAKSALQEGKTGWQGLLAKGLKSKDNNIIRWTLTQEFLEFCNQYPKRASLALGGLWDDSISTADRFRGFYAELSKAGISQSGAQLSLTSVLMLASDPLTLPPVKTQVLAKAMVRIGLAPISANSPPIERHAMFMLLLDALIGFSQRTRKPLRHRLEAQGAVWCAIGGWKTNGLVQTSTSPASTELDDDIADLDAAELQETERETLVLARKGQGSFRNGLLKLWLGCSVTGCRNELLLRASHLKPWRLCNNAERLNPFNGLLLTPDLDTALDRFLISFDKAGKIMLSESLSTADCESLGLHSEMRLVLVRQELLPFLEYHRSFFVERENSFGF